MTDSNILKLVQSLQADKKPLELANNKIEISLYFYYLSHIYPTVNYKKAQINF